MAKPATGHLDQEQIIGAVVDESGLDEAARSHLLECSVCRAERESLERALGQFGRIARERTPLPLRRPKLTTGRSWLPSIFGPGWRINPAIGVAVAFASILALVLNPAVFRHNNSRNLDKVYQEMVQDEKFMAEVERLEEEPLPRFLVDISDPSDLSDERENRSSNGRDEKFSKLADREQC